MSEPEALFAFAFWPDLFPSQDPVFRSVTTVRSQKFGLSTWKPLAINRSSFGGVEPNTAAVSFAVTGAEEWDACC